MAKTSRPKSQETSIELMIFLIDQNLEGYAEILLGAIASKGWLDLIPIQFITFAEIELPANSTARLIEVSMYIDNYLGSRRVFIP